MMRQHPGLREPLSIRPMEHEDVDSVLWIEHECFADCWDGREMHDAVTKQQYVALVAELGLRRVVGYAVCEIHDAHISLERLAVDPVRQRQGVARRLHAEIVTMCNDVVCRLTCVVPDHAVGAQLFLRAMGWRAGAVLRGFYADEDGIGFERKS